MPNKRVMNDSDAKRLAGVFQCIENAALSAFIQAFADVSGDGRSRP
jgi:hypothetical protein